MDKIKFSLDITREGLDALRQLLEVSMTSLIQQHKAILIAMEDATLSHDELLALNTFSTEQIIPQMMVGEEIMRAITAAQKSRIIIPS